MKRKQFSEEQIIGILKDAEAGAVVSHLCRRHGISSEIYYAWKAKFGGKEVSDAERLRALEGKNARLKRVLADTMLDNAGLRTCFQKMVIPAAEREASNGFFALRQRSRSDHATSFDKDVQKLQFVLHAGHFRCNLFS